GGADGRADGDGVLLLHERHQPREGGGHADRASRAGAAGLRAGRGARDRRSNRLGERRSRRSHHAVPPARNRMRLHTDIPTRTQVDRLLDHRRPASVSIYLPTEPAANPQAERTELGNMASEAERRLTDAGARKDDIAGIDELLGELQDDDEFWRCQARTLAVFATPDSITTFRLPHRLVRTVEVSDRFHVKPLLRAITFPQGPPVLPPAQGSLRPIAG